MKLRLILFISSLRLLPHLLFYYFAPQRKIILEDIKRWVEIKGCAETGTLSFITLMTFYREFRNVFYYRIGNYRYILRLCCDEEKTLFINCKSIGGGLYIEHGFSTMILAESIGNNCWINQQVTIGFNKAGIPSIGNNVRITAGVKVLGGVHIGDNVTIGANSVVLKNVPMNSVVVGIPAYITKLNGISVKKSLV